VLSARQTESTTAKATVNTQNPFKNAIMARTSCAKGAEPLEGSLSPEQPQESVAEGSENDNKAGVEKSN